MEEKVGLEHIIVYDKINKKTYLSLKHSSHSFASSLSNPTWRENIFEPNQGLLSLATLRTITMQIPNVMHLFFNTVHCI
jgi:hypothetical protein